MRWLVVAMLALAGPAWGQGILDGAGVPGLKPDGMAMYADFLNSNVPRAFATDGAGHSGWASGFGDSAGAQQHAIALCKEHGGGDCRLYADNLAVVWPGREWSPPATPPALVDTINYGFVPDPRFLWHGPAQAAGVVVWSHGTVTSDAGSRSQPPPLLRPFNDAGYDVIRFERSPLVDNPVRAAGWLRDELAVLRQSGYRRVIAAGQSRGAWTSLQVLDTAGLADVVIALSPAAHGSGASPNLTAQADDLRAMMEEAAPARSRVAVAQFTADPFSGDMDRRVTLVNRLRAKEAAVLVIDRPAGFTGHFGGDSFAFEQHFGACLLKFATDPAPPAACP